MSSLVVSPDAFRVVDGRYRYDEEHAGRVWSQAFVAWRRLVETPYVSHAVLICGAPCSGKTTLAAKISERYRHATRRPAVFDATLSRRATRVRLADAVRTSGKACYAIVMSTSLDECLRRNLIRRASRYAHPLMIEEIYLSLVNDPPTTAEGFAAVEYR